MTCRSSCSSETHSLERPTCQLVIRVIELISPNGVGDDRHLSPLSPFVFAVPGHHSQRQRERDATALPRTECPPWKGGVCDRAFARFTARASARFLLRPLSLATARRAGWMNQSRCTLLGDQPSRRSANSGCRSDSCVSVDLRFRVHVARTCYRPIRTGMYRLPADHTFLPDMRQTNFPLRKQKLGVPLPSGHSLFGTVSSESHWQALSFVVDRAFHG